MQNQITPNVLSRASIVEDAAADDITTLERELAHGNLETDEYLAKKALLRSLYRNADRNGVYRSATV